MPLDDPHAQSARAAAMRLYSLCPWEAFDAFTKHLATRPAQVLREPETGLVMLRGRMGSTGAAFNFGEATVTRCSVRFTGGAEGHAYIMGRNAEHARRAAICDAFYQEDPRMLEPMLQDIATLINQNRQATAAKAAATKVDFFTLVRGDD